eukprot:6068179-Pleurochrysis_carterae.AAC.3
MNSSDRPRGCDAASPSPCSKSRRCAGDARPLVTPRRGLSQGPQSVRCTRCFLASSPAPATSTPLPSPRPPGTLGGPVAPPPPSAGEGRVAAHPSAEAVVVALGRMFDPARQRSLRR